jgi:hypothetical protein
MESISEVQTDSLSVKQTRSYGCRRKLWKQKPQSEIPAAEDDALRTKYHATPILKTEIANSDCVNNMTGQ